MKKKRAVLAGEFDPITDFDYSIIQRCSQVFDEVVLLLVNNDQHAFFLPGERLMFLNEISTYFPNVKVDRCVGMAGSYCQEHEIPVIVRGLQNIGEMEKEAQLALASKRLFPDLETFFLMADPHHMYCTSSVIKELAMLGSEYEKYLPDPLAENIRECFDEHLVIDRALEEVL